MAGLDLRIEGLVQTFADGAGLRRRIVDVPAFTLPAGARLAITGPSGAGKTTLLHLLAGIALPEAGAILWGGTAITRLDEAARDAWRRDHLGLVFQDFHLIDGLSALENVLLKARFGHWRAPADLTRRARALLDRVGVASGARDVATLSRGERQRVAVARAALMAPGVVLADEPTASLDAEAGAEVARLLDDLCRESGASLIAVTHDPDLASRLDVRLDLRDGRLIGGRA